MAAAPPRCSKEETVAVIARGRELERSRAQSSALTLPHRALTRFSIEDEGCVSRGELSQARYGWVGPPEAGGKN